MKFDPDTVDRLFGSEDAESESPERLKEYFVANKAYDNVRSKAPLKILVGHKGVGKSALLRRAHLEDRENKKLSIWLQPSDFVDASGHEKGVPFNKRIANWKSDFEQVVARKAVEQISDLDDAEGISVGKDLVGSIVGVFKKIKPKISDSIQSAILENFLREEEIHVYVDDMDRGWTASKEDIANVSALVNAIRDITNQDRRFRCRIGLRTDVYFLFRTSDESTDKIETNIVWLAWTNDDILRLIAFRVATFFSPSTSFSQISALKYQQNITEKVLKRVIEESFQGSGHWSNRPIHNVLLSLCRARPRDLVKLLHAAAANAFTADHSIIRSSDLRDAFETYSEERLQDLVNEFKSELPDIYHLLLNFKPASKSGKTSKKFQYTTDELIAKIKDIRGRTNLVFTSKTVSTDRDILSFL